MLTVYRVKILSNVLGKVCYLLILLWYYIQWENSHKECLNSTVTTNVDRNYV